MEIAAPTGEDVVTADVSAAESGATVPDATTAPPSVATGQTEVVASPVSTTNEAAESQEFDFGPFREKAMQLCEAEAMIENGQSTPYMNEGETVPAALDRIYHERIKLTAQTLIDSSGEVVIPKYATDQHMKKGVFAELEKVEEEALSKGVSIREKGNSFTFAQAVAAEAVKILLAQRAKPTETESGEPLDDGTTGIVRKEIGEKVDVVEAKTGV